jgi:hypothetical protein
MPITKLTTAKAADLCAMHATGATIAACARAFGVSHTQATRVIRGEAWRGPRRFHVLLSDADLNEVRACIAQGEPVTDIARWYGRSHSLVSLIKSGKRRAA